MGLRKASGGETVVGMDLGSVRGAVLFLRVSYGLSADMGEMATLWYTAIAALRGGGGMDVLFFAWR